eukprot:TRINITY_DN35319_c0_g1_i1.p2 TRINITY_DN35319_c0_g1~~TRINITY_DN35319_c0_g1_i1.p2  ORF type:complete len:61 (-),score=0.06 TRINITY_DN35319_c0_g1_i1:60-242(-)
MVIGVAYMNVPIENIKMLHNDNKVTVMISFAFNLFLFMIKSSYFYKIFIIKITIIPIINM